MSKKKSNRINSLSYRQHLLFATCFGCLMLMLNAAGSFMASDRAELQMAIAKQDSITVAKEKEVAIDPPKLRRLNVHGKIIFIGGQPAAYGHAAWLRQNQVNTTIRLDLEEKAREILPPDQERSLLWEVGGVFLENNIDRFPVEDPRWREQMNQLADEIDRAQTVFIHCLNGVHRAPCLVGFYLARMGFTYEEIVDMVGWGSLAQSPGQYERYLYGVYAETQAYAP